MTDVIASRFEIGHSAHGLTSAKAWIASQLASGNANNIVATLAHHENDYNYLTVILAKTVQRGLGTSVGTNLLAAQFPLRNDFTGLVSFLNAAVAGVSAPAAPVLNTVVAGALTGQGTPSVKVTLVSLAGETAASSNTTHVVADNNQLVVVAPAIDAGKTATGYNVYIGTVGNEKLQNLTPIALGTNYTQTSAVSTTGAVAPSTNGTSAKYIRHLEVISRYQEQIASVIISN